MASPPEAASISPPAAQSSPMMRRPSPTSLSHRICHPPKLERKYSSGDLHSRLKTRKILGVGETDNGDIHRSKISQVLGHNEHLFVKFPRGYWLWHLIMIVLFTVWGLLNTLLPGHFWDMTTRSAESIADTQTKLITRFYGATMLCMAYLLWNFWGVNDKGLIKAVLASFTMCQILQTLTVVFYQVTEPGRNIDFLLLLGLRIIMIAINVFFYRGIGSNTSGMRRSNSFKDLRESLSPVQGSSVRTSSSFTMTQTETSGGISSTSSKKTE